MGLKIHQEKITPAVAEALSSICPFGAFQYDSGVLTINAACKMCRMCVKKGPIGAVTWEDEKKAAVCNKDEWRGVAVFAEKKGDGVHPVTLELIGKAKELAAVTGHPVYALLIGAETEKAAEELCRYGVDKVFVYNHPELDNFVISPYANAFSDFIQKIKPSSVLVGATTIGRSLAPKVAARVGAGLTADCTVLKMKDNTDLVQIRPAFGGNIMAQIVSPNTRPQFCTVRYKIFSAPTRGERSGEIVPMTLPEKLYSGKTKVIKVVDMPQEIDISDAEVIVAVGRGLKSKADIAMAEELAALLGARLACTRPMIEAGWFDAKRQIGLSGRTVKPKIIITLGISGSVQFAAGMRGSDLIVAVNSDPHAALFDIAHYGLVGDLYEILPRLIAGIKEGRYV